MTVPDEINLLLKMKNSLRRLVIPLRGITTWTIQSMNANAFLIVKLSRDPFTSRSVVSLWLPVIHLASGVVVSLDSA